MALNAYTQQAVLHHCVKNKQIQVNFLRLQRKNVLRFSIWNMILAIFWRKHIFCSWIIFLIFKTHVAFLELMLFIKYIVMLDSRLNYYVVFEHSLPYFKNCPLCSSNRGNFAICRWIFHDKKFHPKLLSRFFEALKN